MKKILSVAVLLGLVVGAVDAAPRHITRNETGGYDVTYDYADMERPSWYVSARAELSFLNWKNKYSYAGMPADASANSDKYSFEPVFGASLAGGHRFDYFWRGEVELGYLGAFTDKDQGVEFKLSVPYMMVNAYYDFVNNVYVGAGVGLALPTTELDAAGFSAGDRTERSVSPMGALMAGYSLDLNENMVLDLRYRLAFLSGTTHERTFDNAKFTNDIGLILDNSLSIGLRYEF